MDLTHSRLKDVPEVLASMTQIKVLSLRQNLLKNVDSLMKLETLVELDLYDNELKAIPDLSKLEGLA